MKKIISILMVLEIAVIVYILSWGMYHCFIKDTYCGKVKFKVEYDQQHKYSVTREPLFVVVFNDGITQEISPSWDEYMSLKEGDRVCYELNTYNHAGGNTQRTVLITVGIALVMFLITSLSGLIYED